LSTGLACLISPPSAASVSAAGGLVFASMVASAAVAAFGVAAFAAMATNAAAYTAEEILASHIVTAAIPMMTENVHGRSLGECPGNLTHVLSMLDADALGGDVVDACGVFAGELDAMNGMASAGGATCLLAKVFSQEQVCACVTPAAKEFAEYVGGGCAKAAKEMTIGEALCTDAVNVCMADADVGGADTCAGLKKKQCKGDCACQDKKCKVCASAAGGADACAGLKKKQCKGDCACVDKKCKVCAAAGRRLFF